MSYEFKKELSDLFKNRRESGLIKPKENKPKQINNSITHNLQKNNDNIGNYYTNVTNNNMLRPKIIENMDSNEIKLKYINEFNITKKSQIPKTNPGINLNKTNSNLGNIVSNININNSEVKRAKSIVYSLYKKQYLLNERNINSKKPKSLDNKNDKMNIYFNKSINQKRGKQNEASQETKSRNEITDFKRLRTETIAQKPIAKQPALTKRYSIIKDIKLISKNIYQENDFNVISICGRGAYGTVLQVCLKNDPNKVFAIKKLDINLLNSVNRLYQAYLENQILNELDNPFIIKLYGAFEEDKKIHLVMDYLPKGDLSYFIKTNYPLADDIIKYYSAQIVLFLEYMQKMKLIHRDLKPQNIMIDEKGNLKVIDFGTVQKIGYYYDKKQMRFKEEKLLERLDFQFIGGIDNYFIPDKDDDAYEEEDEEEEESEDENENENENKSNCIKKDIKEKKNNKNRKRGKRKNSFVGTIEYMSPEVIAEKPTEYGTDIWAFGIMLYQMYYNRTPFKKESAYLTFRSIEKSNFEFPHDSSIPKSAKDLIKQILVVDPKKRLGGGNQNSHYDINSLKKHPFFEGIKWNELQNQSPPHMKDYKYFEQKQNNEVSKQRYSICYSANDNRINNNAKIIKKGMLRKKTTWFNYSKRYTILDSTPRLLTKNPNIPEKIKEIPLTKKCKIKLVDNNCFDLKTPIKTYRFKGTNNDGNDWAGDILDAINTYGKNE